MDATLGLLQLALARETMSRVWALACLARAQLGSEQWAGESSWPIMPLSLTGLLVQLSLASRVDCSGPMALAVAIN